ncbi:MAG: helix-turn-helix domain-containing protein [Bacteroidota bacterium]|jgi:excisionase family DNA binding protein
MYNCSSLVLNFINRSELTSCFDALHKQIQSISERSLSDTAQEIYLTRNEVAEMLKCDLSTIHNWTKAGTLNAYQIGGRVYYKKSEIEASMIPIHRLRRK